MTESSEKKLPEDAPQALIREAMRYFSAESWLAHAMSLLAYLGALAQTPQRIESSDPRRERFFHPSLNGIGEGGMMQIDRPPSCRAHSVRSLEDFIAAAKRSWPDNFRGASAPVPAPLIWHDDGGVLLVIDDADRRDYVRLGLEFSHQFRALAHRQAPCLSQKELLSLLRLDIGVDDVTGGKDLMAMLREVRFRQSAEEGVVIDRGKESLDSDVKRDVLGIDGLPERVQLNIPVYSNPGEVERRYAVMYALEVELESRSFRFVPCPNALDEAVQLAQADIRQRIAAAVPAISMLWGSPDARARKFSDRPQS